MSPSEIQASATRLYQQAVDLFKRARKKANRNGEFGELVAYILTEQVLQAPQLIAKMSLKTNSQMPVHGSDGIHVSYDHDTDSLCLIWGEAKCYASATAAISEAVGSIKESLEHKKMERELFLIEQNVDHSGIGQKARDALLDFLDPMSEQYNKRIDRSVALIAFDFDKFAAVKSLPTSKVEAAFVSDLTSAMEAISKTVDGRLTADGISSHTIDFFFFPVPSIDTMRSLFQDKIGWTA